MFITKKKEQEVTPKVTPPAQTLKTQETAPVSAIEPAQPEKPVASWDSLGLSEDLLALIRKAGFEKPTPVQAESIPLGLKGIDLVVSAQTGTGKTAAFAFPLIERVKGRGGTYALVLAPTREIALQTQAVLDQFGAPLGIKSVSLIGGTPLRTDEALLREYPQIIVATPGRICDHLERGNIWLEYIEVVVLDEADRMLEMGFSAQLNRILDGTPNTRQTLLFSATFLPPVEKLAQNITYEPHRIKIAARSRAAVTVEQSFIFIDEDDKFNELQHLMHEEKGTIFVFVRSKDNAAKLWRSLRNRGFHEATQLHSDLEQNVREEALKDFKEGKYRVLIATDVVGRGIHVDEVAHVINFDFPRDAEDYIHRIGRTGRAGETGKATSLITPRDYPNVGKVEHAIKRNIMKDAPQGRPSPSRNGGGRPANHKPASRGGRR